MRYSKIIEQHVKRLTEQANDKPSPFLDEIRRIHRGVESLENLSANRDPMVTEEAHTAKIARSADRLKNEAERAHSRLTNTLVSRLGELHNRIVEQTGLVVRDQYAAEIRQALRLLPEKERFEAFNQALKDGDGQLIAAVSEAPALLSGIPKDMAARQFEALEKMKAGDLVNQRQALNESYDEAVAALRSVDTAVKKGFDPAKLKEIREAEQRHAEAAQGFDRAFDA